MKPNHTEITNDQWHELMGPRDIISDTITEDESVYVFRNRRPFGYTTPGYVNYAKDGTLREKRRFLHNDNLNLLNA